MLQGYKEAIEKKNFMKFKKTIVCVFIFLLFLACFFHRESFFSEKGIGTFDFEYQSIVLPRINFIKNNYSKGISSLWNPFLLSGTPFMPHCDVQFFYLPRIISYLLFSPEISDRIFALFNILVMALGIFLYVKSITKEFSGALLAASLCIVCGPTTVMISSGNGMTLPMLSWWPLILWATEKFVCTEKRKYLFIITFSLWFSILTQQVQILSFLAIFYFFYLIITTHHLRSKKRIIVLRELFTSSFAALLLSGIQLIPSMEFASLSNRLRSYSIANSDPLKPFSFLSLIFPPILFLKKGALPGFVIYFGFLPLFLAFWAIRSGKRMLLFGIFAIVLVLMALGSPIYWFYYKLFPFGKFMNGGEELTFALAIIIPIMTGVGWVSLARTVKSTWLKYILFVIIIVECVGWGECFYKKTRRVPAKHKQVYLAEQKQIVVLTKKIDPLGRFIKFGDTNNIFSDKLYMSYRIYGIGGYNNFTNKKYSDLLLAVEGSMVGKPGAYGESPGVQAIKNFKNLSLPLFDMMNTKYILSSEYLEADQYNLIYNGTIKVYENKKCLPRAFLVDQYEVIKDSRKIIDKIISPQFQPNKTLYLAKQPIWKENKGGEEDVASFDYNVKIVKYEPDKIVISTHAPRNSLLFISDVFYPGWHALIDNKVTEIYATNYAFRSVAVPAGKHVITLYYFPLTLKLGFIFSVAGCILTITQLRKRKLRN